MNRKAVLIIAGVFGIIVSINASAAEYTVDAPTAGVFGTPTSVQMIVVEENMNLAKADKSKNSARIPPKFGSPSSNMKGTGELFTPNLISNYMDREAGNIITGNIMNGSNHIASGNPIMTIPPQMTRPIDDNCEDEVFTAVTDNMYYSGGHIGILQIPILNLSVRVYEGTTNSVLAKGIGHFKDTSIWNGNVCLAAHNRGTNNYFGEIHKLNYGDTIQLNTKKGTRTYKVFNVEKISVNDTSNLQATGGNIITLITCVRNQANYRWCVQAQAN